MMKKQTQFSLLYYPLIFFAILLIDLVFFSAPEVKGTKPALLFS